MSQLKPPILAYHQKNEKNFRLKPLIGKGFSSYSKKIQNFFQKRVDIPEWGCYISKAPEGKATDP
ncbi:hypothetical protein, partial [Phormidium sp. CCY1219]|uniref:hypothetical protein n=1 Tax=Phormidium sp. CCY1219 TaxID=2886104 RepID=UPI002D1F4A34